MQQKKINLYKIEELSKEAKERAINHFHAINVDWEWWDFIYYDAEENLNIKVAAFDVERMTIDHDYIGYAEDSIKTIMRNTGKDTEIYNIAKKYDDIFKSLESKKETIENEIEQKEAELLQEIGEEILCRLRNLYDYNTSPEGIEETISINDYLFTVDGKFFQ